MIHKNETEKLSHFRFIFNFGASISHLLNFNETYFCYGLPSTVPAFYVTIQRSHFFNLNQVPAKQLRIYH